MTITLGSAYSISVLVMVWRLINITAELDRISDELARERGARQKVEEQSLRLVEKVAPLIEQTDWMTGRWHGQFNTLVRLENKRNEAATAARRALWDIPLVADHLKKTFGADQ